MKGPAVETSEINIYLMPQWREAVVLAYQQLRSRRVQFLSAFVPSLGALLLGLLSGSLTGTFLDLPRGWGLWDGALILVIVLVAELRTRLWSSNYQTQNGFEPFGEVSSRGKSKKLMTRQFLKRGFLFAIFLDAFKVGS